MQLTRRMLFSTATVVCVRGLSTGGGAAAAGVTTGRSAPPIARRAAHTVRFGRVEGENRGPNPMDPPIEVVDDLFWLRDDKRKNEEVLGLLREENAYTNGRVEHLADFRSALYDEMLSHLQEDDETVAAPAGDGYEYFSRTIKGSSFRQFLRRPVGSTEEATVYLDVNAVAQTLATPSQCDVREVKPSPSGKLLAYTIDGSGYETYDIRFRDLSSGQDLPELEIKETAGGISWADESTVFYVKFDHAHRPFQVWRHTIGTKQADDALVYEDLDELYNVGCSRSRDGSLIFLESDSKETSEVRRRRCPAQPAREPSQG